MAGYLEAYGAGAERRLKIIRWSAISLLAVAIVGIILYFQFRNYSEEQKVKLFMANLEKKDYKAAYALWGCTDEHPCPQYGFNKFMEDWGPQSPHANAQQAKLAKVKSCDKGIIQFVDFPGQEEVQLWVERKDQTIGFAPWPVCNPR